MTTPPGRDEVLSLLRSQLDLVGVELPADATDDSHLRDDLGIDSLDIVEFVARVEEHYRVSAPDADWQRLGTLGEIADYVVARLG